MLRMAATYPCKLATMDYTTRKRERQLVGVPVLLPPPTRYSTLLINATRRLARA